MPSHIKRVHSQGPIGKMPTRLQPMPDTQSVQYNHGYDTPESDKAIDIFRLFLYIAHYRWMFVSLAVLGLMCAFAITLMMTPKYQASAQLEVVVPSAKVFQDIEVTSEISDLRAFQTAREKMRSRVIAERVVAKLGLNEKVDFLFPRPGFSLFNLLGETSHLILSTEDISAYSVEERTRLAVERLQKNLTINLIPNTSLISISYTDQNSQYAFKIANQIAQSFIDQRSDQTSETSSEARNFIQEQVGLSKARLQQSEEALVEYAKKVGLTVTGDNSSLITASLIQINEALASAFQENLSYGRLVQQINNGQGASLEPVLQSAGLSLLRGKIAELKAEYQQKLGLLKPNFPEMQQLRFQIKELDNQLDLGVRAMTESIKLKHQETQAKIVDLQFKLTELEAEQSRFQDKNIKYTILKREVESDRSQYDSLIAKLNEISVSSELKKENAAIIDFAVEPQKPFSPSLSLNLAIGLILALMTAAAIAYVLELLNNTFASPEQIESELNLAILGIIPAINANDIEHSIADSQSGISEAYRSLRTSLQFSGDQGAPHTLAVTSSEPSEGKSTTIYKLADDFSALGARVLVIDADMRRPMLHRIYKVNNAVGLSNVLTNTIQKNDLPMLIKQIKPNLGLITAGTIPPNPADLLSSSKMGLMLQKLGNNYDLILIDSPPVIGLSDALILGRLTEGTLLVVSHNQVARRAAVTALKRLRSSGANIVGAAFTKFSVQRFDYNYNYRYLSYNYYQYGENSENQHDHIKNENEKMQNKWAYHNIVKNLLNRVSSLRG